MAKLNTVNVIEMDGDGIEGLTSWADDPAGNKAAEAHFKAVVRENAEDVDDEEMEESIENGCFERADGYRAFIVHSGR